MSPAALADVVCPLCLKPLSSTEGGARCTVCVHHYPRDAKGRLDLRISTPTRMLLDYRYDPEWGVFPWDRARLDFPEVPGHIEAVGLADVEANILRPVRPSTTRERALDLGCGVDHARFSKPLVDLGYVATGVDIDGPAPDLLADLHALPFPDGVFDLLTTSAVFEHLKQPHVAMAEAARVCRDGGLFVGAIAFSEPYHISYFHHAPLAVHELLESTGFSADHYVLSADWHAFRAHMDMGYAGARWPSWVRNLVANSAAAFGLAPGWVRSRLLGQKARWDEDRLAFARSHSALVGFVARRRGPVRSWLVRPLKPITG